MKKIYTLFLLLFSVSLVNSQVINITDPSFTTTNPLDCSNYNNVGDINFVDDGGAGANYSANLTEVITICPDIPNGTPKIQGSFGVGQGLTWDVHSSDVLNVYDGDNTSAPLIGSFNNANAPTGFGATASWANASGCLTFEFVSDGANEGTGWEANISCVSPPQDIEHHIEAFINTSSTNAMFPLDTGYVDVCQTDSVLLVAK